MSSKGVRVGCIDGVMSGSGVFAGSVSFSPDTSMMGADRTSGVCAVESGGVHCTMERKKLAEIFFRGPEREASRQIREKGDRSSSAGPVSGVEVTGADDDTAEEYGR